MRSLPSRSCQNWMTVPIDGTSTIFGVISGLWAIATGLGPTLANRIYDVTGGYELALELAIPLFVVTSLLMLSLGRPPEFDSGAVTPESAA